MNRQSNLGQKYFVTNHFVFIQFLAIMPYSFVSFHLPNLPFGSHQDNIIFRVCQLLFVLNLHL